MEIRDDYSFDDLYDKCWGGAKDLLKCIYDNDSEEEFMFYLEDLYRLSTPLLVDVNDFLWHNKDKVLSDLGLNDED